MMIQRLTVWEVMQLYLLGEWRSHRTCWDIIISEFCSVKYCVFMCVCVHLCFYFLPRKQTCYIICRTAYLTAMWSHEASPVFPPLCNVTVDDISWNCETLVLFYSLFNDALSNSDEVTGDWRKLHNEELHNLYTSPSKITMIQVKEYEMGRACSTNGG
jgi:hypothetical protein